MSLESTEDNKQSIDRILTEIGIGRFQVLNYVFVCLATLITTMNCTAYIFTARDTSYRCLIPECESAVNATFERAWLSDAIPIENGNALKCRRYPISNASNACDPALFDKGTTEVCYEWVYGEGDTIVKGFKIPCEDWKRSLVGTINGAGQLLSLLFSGYISDRYGRRNVMIIMTIVMGAIATTQSFSNSYSLFLVLEFLSLTASAGAYAATYIYGVEILASKNRVLGTAVMFNGCTVATLLLGTLAWATSSWRHLLISVNLPAFLMIFAFAIPESARWLSAKGQKQKCAKILRNAARMNQITLTEASSSEIEKMEMTEITAASKAIVKTESSLLPIFKTPQLLLRLLICAFCWFTNVFVYFGLSLNSVNLSGSEEDVYVNFLLATVIEFPALFSFPFLLRFVGRKYAMLSSMTISGLACIAYAVAPIARGSTASLIVYLIGKFFIAMSFAMVYIVTTELFPTALRNSTLNICSILGRVGGALAPQVPLLESVHSSVPMLTYGGFAVVSALTLLKLPETKGKNLPDTLNEAELMK